MMIQINIFNIVNVLVGLDENHQVNIDINPATMISETDFSKDEEEEEVQHRVTNPVTQDTPNTVSPSSKKEPIKQLPPPDSDEEGEKIEEI